MNAKQLNQLLIKRFPELEKKYYEEVEWQEGDETGSHVVYGDVFSSYIEKAIAINDQENLKKIFNFIEEVLLKKDKYAEEVIMFSVLERLLCDKKQIQNGRKYFGECTEKAIISMQ